MRLLFLLWLLLATTFLVAPPYTWPARVEAYQVGVRLHEIVDVLTKDIPMETTP